MLALALQQEDALASASPNQPADFGDEAVAMALQGEERGMLEQQRIGRGNVDTALGVGRDGGSLREDRDRLVTLYLLIHRRSLLRDTAPVIIFIAFCFCIPHSVVQSSSCAR